MTPTKRFWTAKPLLIAYVIAVGFTVGLLVNRLPGRGRAMPAVAPPAGAEHPAHEREVKAPPLWTQLFHPSQPTARMILRMGLPLLTIADGSALESQNKNLLVYWTGKAGDKPQSFFEIMLPFLRTAPRVAEQETPPPVMPPPVTETPPQPGVGADPGGQSPPPPAETPKQEPKSVVQGGQPLVGIYHTHDWESYLSEFPGMQVKTEEELNQIRSFDHKKKTVLDIGVVLAERLRALGVTSVRSPDSHQDLGYDYAYQSSRVTAKRILSKFPSVKVLLDIHRDGVLGWTTPTSIGGKKVAQVRCIIGQADQPAWQNNKAFCDRVIARMEAIAPGTTQPTRAQNDTYNQDLMPGAVLFEVGNAMDAYDAAARGVAYLAQALADVIRSGEYPK